jgi:agmatinase
MHQTKNNNYIYSVPWDITSTFGHGSFKTPYLIPKIMHQLDEAHPFQKRKVELVFEPISSVIEELQSRYSCDSQELIQKCNNSIKLSDSDVELLSLINDASRQVNEVVYNDTKNLLKTGSVILCGGEHGIGIGYLKALVEKYSSISILQIDAHMDCREAYFGYEFSHASVMSHYANLPSVKSITQVGIRDYDQAELEFAKQSTCSFSTFFDYSIHKQLFCGVPWDTITTDIINTLGEHVFISLDIDGLTPYLSPSTGTPVPGGIHYNQLIYLFENLYNSKQIIGAELVEVKGEPLSFDINVGARICHLLGGLFA